MLHNNIIFLSILSLSIVLISSGIYLAIAQIPTTHKVFTKDFCVNETDLLSGILYPNLEELSYDSFGCPTSTKIIHRWNELDITQKNLIITRLTAEGYTEGIEINTNETFK